MSEGLVAPTWSDSGQVPVGEVTYHYEESWEPMLVEVTGPVVTYRYSDWRASDPMGGRWDGGFLLEPAKPSDPNAKPSLPALGKVAGEEYRGLGWCDE